MPLRPQASIAISIGALLALPILVVLVCLHGRPWAPVFDMALIEQHVRDVLTRHTPLLGLAGRFGTPEDAASHPGPLFYYLLAPTYRLLGSTSWALQVAAATVHAGAIATALWLAQRRGGAPYLIAAGIGIAWLMQGHGLTVLTSYWNPYLPALWFVVFIIAVWSVACGDVAVFPIATASASLCAQTHIPYVPVCGALLLLPAIVIVHRILSFPHRSAERVLAARSFVIGASVVLALWLPPILEQITGSPGNMTRLVAYFRSHSAHSIGIRGALPVLLMRLDPWHLVIDQLVAPGGFDNPLAYPGPQPWRGGVSALVWLASAIGAIRYGSRSLRILHGVLGLGLLVALAAMSRIFGEVWNHIVLWGWALGALMLVATAATLIFALSRIALSMSPLRAVAPWLGVGVVAVSTLRLAWQAPDFKPRRSRPNEQLAALLPAVTAALESGVGAAKGRMGRYVVTWTDGFYGGGQAFGLANELERAGFDVNFEPPSAGAAGAHRTMPKSEATAQIHFANGAWIKRMKRFRGAVEVARFDPRTPQDLDEYSKLRAAVVESLRAAGRRDLARSIDFQLPPITPDLPPLIALSVGRLADLGVPAAVFIMPPDATWERARKKNRNRRQP